MNGHRVVDGGANVPWFSRMMEMKFHCADIFGYRNVSDSLINRGIDGVVPKALFVMGALASFVRFGIG
jgi:hypothetical protein